MQVDEAALLKELVDRTGDLVADAKHGAEGVRPRPQVGDGAEELHRVAFFLQRIVRRHAVDVDRARPSLRTSGPCRANRRARRSLGRGAGLQRLDFGFVAGQRGVDDALDRVDRGAVVDFEERSPLLMPSRPQPAVDDRLPAGLRTSEKLFDSFAFMRNPARSVVHCRRLIVDSAGRGLKANAYRLSKEHSNADGLRGVSLLLVLCEILAPRNPWWAVGTPIRHHAAAIGRGSTNKPHAIRR